MTFRIIPAQPDHLPAIAQLAGELVRLHYSFDPRRYLLVDDVESGYEEWFRRELRNRRALILAAVTDDEAVVGYAYARLEPRDWNALLDEHAAIHDLFIAERARRSGLGEQLMQAVLSGLREKGAKLVVLHTATENATAQRLFARAGFRPSMLEMSKVLEP